MPLFFCVRPATPNIGNDLINKATADLIKSVFGSDVGIVNIPALKGPQYGGFTARQVYDMNRLADGIVIGGGNLFENGQLTIDSQALDALRVPAMIIGVSHGRIFDTDGRLSDRTDALSPQSIRKLAEKSSVVMVRDRGSQSILQRMGVEAEVSGCPSLFLPPNPTGYHHDGRVLLSIRHPGRMSVEPALQWRIAEIVRQLITALRDEFGNSVVIVCHDYNDIEFAKGFPDVPMIYFDDVEAYILSLRSCRLNVSFRLHAFLPCLAFGTPSIHLSYDERGKEMVATSGMEKWDVDLSREHGLVDAVMDRARNPQAYMEMRLAARTTLVRLQHSATQGVKRFADAVLNDQQARKVT